MDLSIIIPSLNEVANLKILLPRLKNFAQKCTDSYEIIVVEGRADSGTVQLCKDENISSVLQQEKGFGKAIWEGIKTAQGQWVVSMDADSSHDPSFLPLMWEQRKNADLIIASRYMPGGFSEQKFFRKSLSEFLNFTARLILDIPIFDLTGGFKLYRKKMFDEFELNSNDFNIQLEAIIKSYAFGFRLLEIPYHFRDRAAGKSRAHIIKYGYSFFKSIFSLWRLRNTVYFADYDARAFRSRLWPQRYWHQSRYSIARSMLDESEPILNLGCGTSRMMMACPDQIGIDYDVKKIRFLRKFNSQVMVGDARTLPFPDSFFAQVVCLEVIEHIMEADKILDEIKRILKPGGILVLSTPDYGNGSLWPLIEKLYALLMPGAYAGEHVFHCSRQSLIEKLAKRGFKVEEVKVMFRCILHIKAVKT